MVAKYRRWILPVLALAVFGWIKLQGQRPVTAASQAAAGSSESAPTVTRRLGQLAFTPCTLAPDFGTQTAEAQCSSLQVPATEGIPSANASRRMMPWSPSIST